MPKLQNTITYAGFKRHCSRVPEEVKEEVSDNSEVSVVLMHFANFGFGYQQRA